MLHIVVFVSLCCLALVAGHGRLEEPPGRSTMWRYGYKTEVNVNDAELFCGGITRLWRNNNGKCGICGDPWDAQEPRPNEDGGIYGKGIVVRTYKSGQEMTAITNIVANHMGWMEYKLCPVDGGVKADQECLDKHPIPLADGSGYRYDLGRQKGPVSVKLRLPEGLKCERCVFQWHWRCANNWGICDDKKGRNGCGPQEYFRGCADIKIE